MPPRKRKAKDKAANVRRNQRKQGRSLVQLEVRYRVSEAFSVDLAHDVSPGGMFIETRAPLPKGTVVEFYFGNQSDERRVLVEGRVVWSGSQKTTSKKRTGMGIEFTRVDMEGQRLIDELIHDFLRKVSII